MKELDYEKQIGDHNDKVPQIPRQVQPTELIFSHAFDKANVVSQREKYGLGAPLKQDSEAQERIERMLNLIEEKTIN